MPPGLTDQAVVARRLTFTGGVQGLGIRPGIARLARALGLAGSVRNDMAGIVVELEGSPSELLAFQGRIQSWLREVACIDCLRSEPIARRDLAEFQIVPSSAEGALRAHVPLDFRICDGCLQEVRTPGNRRHGYAFTSCTTCGPRYSLLRSMPYDRSRTSMDLFAMCEECLAEYASPDDRRFHSQINCCPSCGPRIWYQDDEGGSNEEPIARAMALIRRGGVLALKGLGGYQLVCDATQASVVERLRERKGRRTKPLAVMVGSPADAEGIAIFAALERTTLDQPAGPIVLLKARPGSGLADSISPGLDTVGVMLPTTALHALIVDACQVPLVVTSGNLEGEPLVYKNDEAERLLADLADGFLHHDRDILRPVDDSVVRCMAGRTFAIRAARGLAPQGWLVESQASGFAVGGQQKSSQALAMHGRMVLGPHVGDLDSEANRLRWIQQAQGLQALYDCHPEFYAHDRHPDYFSTRWVGGHLASPRSIAIQHHQAHIAAGMLENGWLDDEVLGVAMDGTGLGVDGSIQGGEILLGAARRMDRVGWLRPFPLLGGEASIREPARVALALLHASLPEGDHDLRNWVRKLGPQAESYWRMIASGRHMTWTTSAGRLFDGVAALLFLSNRPTYEGEWAMRLEAFCDRMDPHSYRFSIQDVPTLHQDSIAIEMDWRPLVRGLVHDLRSGTEGSAIAMRFHRGLATAIAEVADRFPGRKMVLSGGVFQNRVLVELLEDLLRERDRTIGWCAKIPSNDGGLAMGQLVAALRSVPDCHRHSKGDQACV